MKTVTPIRNGRATQPTAVNSPSLVPTMKIGSKTRPGKNRNMQIPNCSSSTEPCQAASNNATPTSGPPIKINGITALNPYSVQSVSEALGSTSSIDSPTAIGRRQQQKHKIPRVNLRLVITRRNLRNFLKGQITKNRKVSTPNARLLCNPKKPSAVTTKVAAQKKNRVVSRLATVSILTKVSQHGCYMLIVSNVPQILKIK